LACHLFRCYVSFTDHVSKNTPQKTPPLLEGNRSHTHKQSPPSFLSKALGKKNNEDPEK